LTKSRGRNKPMRCRWQVEREVVACCRGRRVLISNVMRGCNLNHGVAVRVCGDLVALGLLSLGRGGFLASAAGVRWLGGVYYSSTL